MIHNIILLTLLLSSTISDELSTLVTQSTTAFNQKQFPQVVALLSQRIPSKNPSISKQHLQHNFHLFEILGQSYDALRNDQKTMETYEKLLTLQAKHHIKKRSLLALNGLGLLLSRIGNGNNNRATDLMEEAAFNSPNNHGLMNNVGTVLHKNHQLTKAVTYYTKAWSLSSNKIKVYGYNLGNSLMDIQQHQKAVAVLRKVIRLDKLFPEAHWKLARCYATLHKYKKASRSFRAALKLTSTARKFNEADVRFELHDSYLGERPAKHLKAIHELEKAVALEPNNSEYVYALEHLYRYIYHYNKLQNIQFKSKQLLQVELNQQQQQQQQQQQRRPYLSPMRALAFLEPAPLMKLMHAWSNSMLQDWTVPIPSPPPLLSTTSLRIGFISSEWESNSPMMHLMDRLPLVLSQNDPSLQVHVYTFKSLQSTETTATQIYPESTSFKTMSFQNTVSVTSLHNLKDPTAAETISQDNLDFLIELNGFTEGGRPELLSMLRGSTLSIVSYLGWPATFGDVRLIQYAVVDRYVVPIEQSRKYMTEKLFILPHSLFVGDHDYKMSANHKNRKTMKEYDLQRSKHRHILLGTGDTEKDRFLFCNFNQLFKLSVDHVDTVGLWSNILHRSSSSMLWLLRHPAVAEPFVRTRLMALGIQNTARLLFSNFVNKKEYLARSSAGDLFLDNNRYNAGATGVDALYSGVPVLTMPTDRIVGRFGLSQQQAMSSKTVTWNIKTYENVAVYISTRPRLANGIRRKVRQRRKNDLFDMNGFAKDFTKVMKMSKEMEKERRNSVVHAVVDTRIESEEAVPVKEKKRMHVVHTNTRTNTGGIKM